ncbi:hypothetical protein [Mycobacteroides abscessus]|uniref:hypothetical protein n=2 Tax=Mycobacteroides abscessus TaxID=36809 RepID=UPI0009A83B99|nr:hypothetical protein [Mycobacteroides abscessus]SKF90020.1 Uncharacterised protein [Mycobacteroides abscessus subsp. bolletii]SKG24997.1 Uncharacterised protein [Mycobacteroides abscessus subsp. bolletii]SKH26865.1 Uncharacterised protein [Mycobacteroides abscessus subsp. bolletii]SKH59979.1 Uncharacterised protein [Mycobacteroides abscessus subsp. bolletii]SKH91291.1 Uncharacterised protein [Mycobacteroides abscessus subsp. bolletii]
MSHRNPDNYQRVGIVRTAIMRHAFWTVAALALVYALVMLAAHQYAQFAICMALVLAASCIDLWVHRRGRYRDRSAELLLCAALAIAVTALFAQVGVTA